MSNASAKAETTATSTATDAAAALAPITPKAIMDALEEDDEFEEFENEQWSKNDTTAAQIPTQQQQWMDNWDDDMDDDFTKSLRAALTKDK